MKISSFNIFDRELEKYLFKKFVKNFKNIYIIDGSVFDFKINKYPLGLLMANARRIAKEIK